MPPTIGIPVEAFALRINLWEFSMSAGAAAAAAEAERQRLEEEEMTKYTDADLQGDWVFKIVRPF
jgi:hypothetical protein